MSESMIGKSVWRFDENHRVYPKDNRFSSGPIYREYWVQTQPITGETSRSWLIGDRWKIPKNGERRGWALTQAEVDDYCWVDEHRYTLIRFLDKACRDVRNIAKLREIAKQVGYKADI